VLMRACLGIRRSIQSRETEIRRAPSNTDGAPVRATFLAISGVISS
jgi:hypothetical protein